MVEPEAIDWPRFLATAKRHRVEPLAHVGLDRLGIVYPPEVLDRLEAQRRSIAASNLRAIDQIAELDEALDRAGIDHVWLKGLALSKLAYGDAFVKANADLDLLVRRSDLRRTADLLGKLGYRWASERTEDIDLWHRVRKDSDWRREGSLPIDLHCRLSDSPTVMRQIGIQSPRQRVEIARGIRIETFATPYLLLHLAGHGTDCAWFRMKWACDIAALLEGLDCEQQARMIDHARDGDALRAWIQAVGFAATLFEINTLSHPITGKIKARDRLAWKLGFAQLAADVDPNERLFGTIGIHLGSLLKVERIGDLPKQLLQKARLATTRV